MDNTGTTLNLDEKYLTSTPSAHSKVQSGSQNCLGWPQQGPETRLNIENMGTMQGLRNVDQRDGGKRNAANSFPAKFYFAFFAGEPKLKLLKC